MHWRAVLFSLLALAAAVLYAVQRETFVRRWLVDPAAHESAAAASLGRVLPEVRLTNATLDEAAAELSRLGGVRVRVDPGVYAARMGDLGSVTLRLRGVTLAEAVAAALAPAGGGPECYPTIVPRGGELLVLMPADARKPMAVRAYDVADLLPPDGPAPPWSGGMQARRGVVGLSDRREVLAGVSEAVSADLDLRSAATAVAVGGPFATATDARAFGSRLIVTAPAVDADRAAHLLAAFRRGRRPLDVMQQ